MLDIKGTGMRLMRTLAALVICCAVSTALAEDLELARLLQQLNSDKVEAKTKAARELGEIGPAAAKAVPGLLKALETDNPGLRHEATVALGKINSDPAQSIPALGKVLSDKFPFIQFSAIEALGKFGPDAKSAVPLLKKSLADKEPLISVSAAKAIVQIEWGNDAIAGQVIPTLITGLKNERSDISTEAIQGLAMLGPLAVTPVQELVTAQPTTASLNACDVLMSIGPAATPALPKLVAASKSADSKVKWHAMNAIGSIGPDAKSAVQPLVTGLSDPDEQVKLAAGQALQRIGKASVSALVTSLKDERLAAVVAGVLGGIGPDAAEAVPALGGLLKLKDPEVRREVILALASIGPPAKSTVPDLIKILGDGDFQYRGSAAFALGKIGDRSAESALKKSLDVGDNPVLSLATAWALVQLDPTNDEYVKIAIPKLITGLEHDNPMVRQEAARTLGEIGPRSKSAVPALRKKLADPAPPVQREALVALGEIGAASVEAVPDIMRILTDGEPAFRSIASYSLGRIGEDAKAAVPQLTRLLVSRAPHERTVAAWALLNISADRKIVEVAIPLIAESLQHAPNPETRVESAKTLGKFGTGSKVAKDALNEGLSDPEEIVKKACEAAIAKLK